MSETESFATASPGDDFVYLAAFQQLVLERTHDLITVLDPTGMIVFASPSWRAMTGWDPDALVGTPILELVHPDDHKRGAQGMARALSGEAVEAVTARLRTTDGHWVSVETTGTPVYGDNGKVAYVLGTARDVSEREALREARRRSRRDVSRCGCDRPGYESRRAVRRGDRHLAQGDQCAPRRRSSPRRGRGHAFPGIARPLG